MGRKIFSRRLLIAATILLLLAAMPAGVFAVEGPVCQIGETTYETLDAALAEVNDGETITLLDNINHSSQITVTGKGITFDLNGFTLNVTNAAGKALEVGSGGEAALTGEGSLNVFGNGLYGHGVYAHDGGKATVTNATGSGTHARAAQAEGPGSAVTVRGSATSVNSQGVFAVYGGSITVEGDVTGHYSGAYAEDAAITIGGNATSNAEGAYAISGGTITIGGDAVSNGDSDGAYAVQTGSSVMVTGNAISKGDYGRGAFAGAGAAVTVHGDAVSEGNDGYGAYASGANATIDIEGNVSSEYGLGAWVRDGGSITVEGTITAETYIKLQDTVKVEADGIISGGYLVYTDDTSTVWVMMRSLLEEGSGTEADPYQITDRDQLAYIAQQVNLGTDYSETYFELVSNIDLGGINWTPIGNAANKFNGHFDGKCYVISNLAIGTSSSHNTEFTYLGLFGSIGSGASVSNVLLTDIAIYSSTTGPAGGLVGLNDGGTIDHCGSSGEIVAFGQVGGLVGLSKGIIANSFASVNITSDRSSVGGLLGDNNGGHIINCYATGNVSAGAYPHAGGLVGYTVNWSGTSYIQNCYATGNVSGSAWGYIGGIFGRSYQGTAFINNYWNEDAEIVATEYQSYIPDVHGSAEGYLAKPSAELKTEDFAALLNSGRPDPEIHYGWEIVSGMNSGYPIFRQTLEDVMPPTMTGNDISFTDLTHNSVTLNWNKAADNISAQGTLLYLVYQSDTNNIDTVINIESNGTPAGEFAEDINTMEITGLSGGTTYYFNIIVKDEAGNKTAYAINSITTNLEPSSGSSGGSSYTPPAIVVATQKTDETTKTTTEVSASGSSGVAEAGISTVVVDALLNKADAENGTSKEDVIEVSVNTPAHTSKLEVNIPQAGLNKIAEKSDAGFGITSPLISITFDGKAIETISGVADGDNITVSAGIIDNTKLSEKDRARVADRPVYDLGVKNGNVQVSHFGGGHATVRIPYILKQGENPNSVVIYYLSDNGSLKTVRGHFDATAGAVVFKTTHFSNFIIAHNPVTFSDVRADAWYKDAVDFIAARGITSGTGDGIYSPDMRLTRGQFMVLLMNAYQIEPAGGSADSAENGDNTGNNEDTGNFTDAGNTYYTNYLAAAKSLGIANGVGNNMFAPDKEITRQEMFVLLYNALKVIDELPPATTDKELGAFSDADSVASWASEAMSALVKGGIVSGSDNRLSPAETSTRAQMAQVLYNLLAK